MHWFTPVFWKSKEYTIAQDRHLKFRLSIEENAVNSINNMEMLLPFESGGLKEDHIFIANESWI